MGRHSRFEPEVVCVKGHYHLRDEECPKCREVDELWERDRDRDIFPPSEEDEDPYDEYDDLD